MEEIPDEEQDELREILQTLDLDPDEVGIQLVPKQAVAPPPPIPIIKNEPEPVRTLTEDYKFDTNLEQYEHSEGVESRQFASKLGKNYETPYAKRARVQPAESNPYEIGRKKSSKVRNLLRSLRSKKDLIILNEVLNQPREF